MSNERQSNPKWYLYYRHSLPVRIMHWIAVLSLPILLMSGLNIFNANPELHWGKSSYNGVPPLFELRSKVDSENEITEGVTRLFGYEFNTTGFLGASNDLSGELTSQGFPSWLTLPGYQWLAMARRWHLFFAWVFAINSFCFVCYSIYSRHLQKDLLPTKQDWQSIGITIRDHILLRHPTGNSSKSYNVLQKVAYIGVTFLLFPLVIINGLGMSPGIDALIPGWVDVFGGRQSMRTIHFIISCGLVAFTAVHLFQVIITGFLNNIRSMITGNYRIKTESEHESE